MGRDKRETLPPGGSYAEIAETLQALWSEVTPEETKIYEARQEESMKMYENELMEYRRVANLGKPEYQRFTDSASDSDSSGDEGELMDHMEQQRLQDMELMQQRLQYLEHGQKEFDEGMDAMVTACRKAIADGQQKSI